MKPGKLKSISGTTFAAFQFLPQHTGFLFIQFDSFYTHLLSEYTVFRVRNTEPLFLTEGLNGLCLSHPTDLQPSNKS